MIHVVPALANNAFHLTVGLAFARTTAGDCERSPYGAELNDPRR
jgi:hypothetical protein